MLYKYFFFYMFIFQFILYSFPQKLEPFFEFSSLLPLTEVSLLKSTIAGVNHCLSLSFYLSLYLSLSVFRVSPTLSLPLFLCLFQFAISLVWSVWMEAELEGYIV